MTTFDRAFIKAFTDAPVHPAVGPTEAVTPPHVAQVQPARVRLGGSPARASEVGESTRRENLVPPPRPLSSFTPQPKLQDSCRALLEVDRFAWPTATLDLLARARTEWDLFAEQLIERMAQGQKCLAVASTGRGDGRTTVTLALAKLLAERGLRTVAVDADCDHPTLVNACGVSVHTGWDDQVNTELVPGESLIAAVEEGVTLMPWRTPAPSGHSLPTSQRAATLFATLREHYDLTVIDARPLVGETAVGDFANFAKAAHVDALYLVHNLSLPDRESLAGTCAKLRLAGLPVAGVIENFVSSRPPVRPAFPGSSALPRHRAPARHVE